MPSGAVSKSARLDTRITPELHEQLRRVAELQGRFTFEASVEVEGHSRPALVAETIAIVFD
jgi:hypothetical protein